MYGGFEGDGSLLLASFLSLLCRHLLAQRLTQQAQVHTGSQAECPPAGVDSPSLAISTAVPVLLPLHALVQSVPPVSLSRKRENTALFWERL